MPYRRGVPRGAGGSRIPKTGQNGKGDATGGHSDGHDADADLDKTKEGGIDKILSELGRLNAKIDGIKDEMREGFNSSDFSVKELGDKVQTAVNRTEACNEQIKEISDTTAGLKTRSEVHGTRLSAIERRIEQIEREKRRNILIVEGAPESEENPSPEIINSLFRDLKLNFDSLVCDRIHRRGKQPQETGDGQEAAEADENKRGPRRPRPIVVGFKELHDKIQVFKNLSNLKGLEQWNGVFVGDDLTETQQRQLRDLKALSAYARSEGIDARIRSNCIVVEGRKYRYEEIHRLAPRLSLEKAKTLTCLKGEGIAFQSEHSPLSNLYPCNVLYKGRFFLSSEGALQYERAICCKRFEEARLIEFERCAYEIKRIASNLKFSEDWEKIMVKVLEEILYIKFTANQYCKRVLLSTGDKQLFEATGDRTWACGLPLRKIGDLTLPTPGKNRMGLALERVRSKIKSIQV